MTYPNVTFEEVIDGAAPVRSRSANRAGAIGTSKKGQYNKMVLIDGTNVNDIANKIGVTLDTGSVGVQVAVDEGATNVGFVRVMGAAKKASASFKLAGTGGVTADILRLTVTQDLADKVYETPITSGATATQLAASLCGVVSADATAIVTATPDGSIAGGIILSAKVLGLAGNTISYTTVEVGVDPDDITVTNSAANLNGGYDAPECASVEISDLKLVAIPEGTYGDGISYKTVPGILPGTVDVTLTDEFDKTETFTVSFTADDLINGTELAKFRTSNMVRGYFTGDITDPDLPTSTNGFLSGGSDGSPITVDDYIEALKVLGNERVNVIWAPSREDASIKAALIAQAANAPIINGLRFAVVNGPRGLEATDTACKAASNAYNSKDSVMVNGWCTYAGQPRLAEKSVSPDSFYVGHLMATKTFISPSARSSAPFFKTVLDVDTLNTDSALTAYTDNRMEAIILDPVTGGFHCLNGRTLASDGAHYYVCIERKGKEIKADLFYASQALKSEPKRGNLLSSISTMVDTYMKEKTNIGEINGGGTESIVKTANGTRCDYRWYPVYPADGIDYGMHRYAMDV